jgi:hypothetical protein
MSVQGTHKFGTSWANSDSSNGFHQEEPPPVPRSIMTINYVGLAGIESLPAEPWAQAELSVPQLAVEHEERMT